MQPRQSEYEMGYTPKEFSRVLEGNFTGEKSEYRATQIEQNHWQLNSLQSDINVDLKINEQAPRKLGHFSLPVLKVVFSVTSSSEELSRKFFDKFFKYFHKGGG
jgi:hypothetical protein